MRFVNKNIAAFGVINFEMAEPLEKFFADNMRKDKRWENYKPKKLDLASHLTYDVLVEEQSGEIVTGCGVYNGGRYKPGVYRIMNRVFLNPLYRKNTKEYPFLATQYLLKDQLSKGAEEIDFPFVSREGKYAYHFLDMWTKAAKEVGLGEWVVSEGFAHVAPKGRDQKCFQRIAYPAHKENPFDLLTENEWSEIREHKSV